MWEHLVGVSPLESLFSLISSNLYYFEYSYHSTFNSKLSPTSKYNPSLLILLSYIQTKEMNKEKNYVVRFFIAFPFFFSLMMLSSLMSFSLTTSPRNFHDHCQFLHLLEFSSHLGIYSKFLDLLIFTNHWPVVFHYPLETTMAVDASFWIPQDTRLNLLYLSWPPSSMVGFPGPLPQHKIHFYSIWFIFSITAHMYTILHESNQVIRTKY